MVQNKTLAHPRRRLAKFMERQDRLPLALELAAGRTGPLLGRRLRSAVWAREGSHTQQRSEALKSPMRRTRDVLWALQRPVCTRVNTVRRALYRMRDVQLLPKSGDEAGGRSARDAADACRDLRQLMSFCVWTGKLRVRILRAMPSSRTWEVSCSRGEEPCRSDWMRT